MKTPLRIPGINYIVYVMLENRSLDNVLGWLYDQDNPNVILPPQSTPAYYDGLQQGRHYNPDGNGNIFPVTKITPAQGQTIPSVDPNEEFDNVQTQIENNMMGFYIDFATTDSPNPAEIMECFTPESLPVLNSLAKNFAVSDAYFSSIPTQTNCNRAFSLTGNSIGVWDEEGDLYGMVNNYWEKDADDFGDPYEFNQATIWDVLSWNNPPMNDWTIFYSQTWPGVDPYYGSYCFTKDLLYPSLQNYDDNHFQSIDRFFRLAESGTLPAFSFVEPLWYEEYTVEGYTFGHRGTDYHPPDNMACGEQFLYKVYNALKTQPDKWAQTLLIINFDEHGGTYDHVEPPATTAPWANPNDGTAVPDGTEENFDFQQLGVRVPLILVSPKINEKIVFRAQLPNGDPSPIPFDHTSVIATILEHFEIPRSQWGLGTRTANAPTFGHIIDPFCNRTDVAIDPPILSCPTDTTPETVVAGDLQKMIMHRFIYRIAQKRNFPKAQVKALCNQHLLHAKTMQEVSNAGKLILDTLSSLPPQAYASPKS